MDAGIEVFAMSDLTRASGMTTREATNLVKRPGVVPDVLAPIEYGTGKRRFFSWSGIVGISLAARINTLRNDWPKSLFASCIFVGTSSVTVQWAGAKEGSPPMRKPGYPWHHDLGRTILSYSDKHPRVHLVRDADDMDRLVHQLMRHGDPAFLVDCGQVFDRVCAAVGSHPLKVLDRVYPDVADD